MSTNLRVVTRRQVLAGSAVGAAALASGFPSPSTARVVRWNDAFDLVDV